MAAKTTKKDKEAVAETPETETKAVAVVENNLPATADLMGELVSMAGQGTEEITTEDIQIPFLYMLQKGSPQVNKNKPEFIDDAEVGDIFNTASQAVYSGEAGVVVIPCYYQTRYVEWKPRTAGGGFVKDHGTDSQAYDTALEKEGKRYTPEGNEVVRAATFFVLIVDEETGQTTQAIISLSSTALTPAKKWNTLIKEFRLVVNGKAFNSPIFGRSYRITSKNEQNAKGDWMQWVIKPEKPITDYAFGGALLEQAKAFYDIVHSGAAKIATPAAGVADEDIPF